MAVVERTEDTLLLSGSLDVRGASEVRAALHRTLDAVEGDVTVDLTGLDAIDAAGMAVLVAAHRRARSEGRRLVLDGVQPALARLLAGTRPHRVLVIRRVGDSTPAT